MSGIVSPWPGARTRPKRTAIAHQQHNDNNKRPITISTCCLSNLGSPDAALKCKSQCRRPPA
eukprot:2811535-Amphidinium_carterae.1